MLLLVWNLQFVKLNLVSPRICQSYRNKRTGVEVDEWEFLYIAGTIHIYSLALGWW